MATRQISLIKRTLSAINCPSEPVIRNSAPRYQQKISANGQLFSQRTSCCKTAIILDQAIKKRRLLRQGRSKSQLKSESVQRATIATDKVYQIRDQPSIGHCINHLESILSLLKQQKVNQRHQTKQPGKVHKITNNKEDATTQKKDISKRYRTISHQENIQSASNICTLQPKQSIVLKFKKNENTNEERQDSQKKILLAKVISDTKRDSKTLKLKEVRDRYKHLSKSKSIQENEMMSVKKVQSIRNSTNQSNRRYGRKLIRVCSIGNYQMSTHNKETSTQKNAKYQNYQMFEEDNLKKKVFQLAEEMKDKNTKLEIKKPIHEQNLNQSRKKSIQSLKGSPMVSDRNSKIIDSLDINCSSIEQKPGGRSVNSFFSEAPSYFKQPQRQKQAAEKLNLKDQSILNLKNKANKSNKSNKNKSKDKVKKNMNSINPFDRSQKNQEDRNSLLNLVAMNTIEIKKIFKSKQRRRQLQKWKKNFPEGFFDNNI